MYTLWQLVALALIYVSILFLIAWWGESAARQGSRIVNNGWTYTFGLGVYCTSWTFFGSVGEAVHNGWNYLPIYLGPILFIVLGGPVIYKIVSVGKQQRITSIADFLAARYGKNPRVAMLATVIALFGVLPYLALQLKGVSLAFEVLSDTHGKQGGFNSAFVIAALMATFTLLFGTRHLDATSHQAGLMLAVAFESLVKLVAFLAVAVFCFFHLFDGALGFLSDDRIRAAASAVFQHGWGEQDFMVQVLLAMTAIICLPRQFHATVVANSQLSHLRTTRWLAPLYLLAFAVGVLPIALAGVVLQPQQLDAADMYLLTLPLEQGPAWLTLLAFLGGIAAATGMVIVASIAVSIMVSNEILLPLWMRRRVNLHEELDELGDRVRLLRRIALVGVMFLGFVFHQLMESYTRLASIGILAFAAVAQFAPALFGGLYWRRGHARGVMVGLSVGFLTWGWTLLLPGLGSPEWVAVLQAEGPFGWGWLRPQALFGLEGLSPLTHGVLWSLGLNTLAYVLVSRQVRPSNLDTAQATFFVDMPVDGWRDGDTARQVPQKDLFNLASRCLGAGRAELLFREYADRRGVLFQPERPAPLHLIRFTEQMIAGAMGASSARILMGTLLTQREADRDEVARIMDEASRLIQFNHQLLRTTFETIAQGICVVDRDLNIVAWNQAYEKLFEYPQGLLVLGRPIADVYRFNARRGFYGPGNLTEQVRRRVNLLREGSAHNFERVLPNGTVIEVTGMPMRGGGFVTTFLDITERKRDEWALRQINENLETIVNDRTRELSALNTQLQHAIAEAERANQGKTLFLAAAGHDLMQPLNAAQLFCSSLQQRLHDGVDEDPVRTRELVGQIGDALHAAESLISDLLDISRLDTGAMPVDMKELPLSRVLGPLAAEFQALAASHGLAFRWVPSSQRVRTDEKLLRRVIQNLLANAVRYTERGTILLGCRRQGRQVRVEVWDTGAGIEPPLLEDIFREFKRLHGHQRHGNGLGLGLAIADRICGLLGADITVRSWPGQGTCFAVTLETVAGGEDTGVEAATLPVEPPGRLDGLTILCIDNQPSILAGLDALLSDWGCRVLTATCLAEARQHARLRGAPDLLLVDYQLDDEDGFDVIEVLDQEWDDVVPAVLMTASHDPALPQRAADLGIAFLHKPVNAGDLMRILQRLV